ncbi:hypothetical protein [Pseudomonas palleroniana]|uniref:Uncharacterized protein n=1 Tax=Pseudomonas palleroniana TaxID=191390 RepID=A0A0X7K8Q7_9PSED|nr:hypothetical protein [Pseudomonas palleroniana]KWU52053.1 hypothetical protein AWV77_04265 [Pseudomonas palleroniana]
MSNAIDTAQQSITIEYLLDTLFGVNVLTTECLAQKIDKAPGFQLRLAPPWPSQLKHAHSIAFEWHGSACRGVVQHAEPLPSGDLLLDIEPQPR